MSFTIRTVHDAKHQLPEHSQSFDVDLKTHYTYTVFQEEDAFIYLDDRYFALMYITTPHGYIRG